MQDLRDFYKNFSTVVNPLTSLISPSHAFLWSKECQNAFENRPYYVVLLSLQHQSMKKPSSWRLTQALLVLAQYLFKKISTVLTILYVTSKETLALMLALQYFDVYLSSSNLPIIVFTDHNPLVFLSRMYNQNQRLMRWSLVVQSYNLMIEHKIGSENIMADALSRA